MLVVLFRGFSDNEQKLTYRDAKRLGASNRRDAYINRSKEAGCWLQVQTNRQKSKGSNKMRVYGLLTLAIVSMMIAISALVADNKQLNEQINDQSYTIKTIMQDYEKGCE